MSHAPITRRRFLETVGAAAAAAPLWSLRSRAAGQTLRHASIGASGQALSDLKAFATHPCFELVAVADVDLGRFEALQTAFPKVRVYQDWRELLEREHDHIDSVNVSVPDHMIHRLASDRRARYQTHKCRSIQRDGPRKSTYAGLMTSSENSMAIHMSPRTATAGEAVLRSVRSVVIRPW